MIILVQQGRAHAHNAQKWSEWGAPLHIEMSEPLELISTLKQLKDQSFTHVWLADSSYEPLPTCFRLFLSKQIWDQSVFTIFKAARPTFVRMFYDEKLTADHDEHDKYGGLRYVQIDAAISDMEYDKTCGGVNIDYNQQMAAKLSFPYSVFHLTSHEPAIITTPTYEAVKRLYPSVQPHWSEGTILESHKALAERSDSDMFFVIDGDCLVTKSLGVESFKPWDEEYVHVWYVQNPINGLVYGHGGPKAFNRKSFVELESETVDVTTSSNRKQLIVHEDNVGYHRFNWSEEATFRTAFREAAKLTWLAAEGGEGANAAQERLMVWTNIELANQDQPFWEECVDGAECGSEWAEVADENERTLINDWDWLHEQYQLYMAEVMAQVNSELDDEDDLDDPASDFEDQSDSK